MSYFKCPLPSVISSDASPTDLIHFPQKLVSSGRKVPFIIAEVTFPLPFFFLFGLVSPAAAAGITSLQLFAEVHSSFNSLQIQRNVCGGLGFIQDVKQQPVIHFKASFRATVMSRSQPWVTLLSTCCQTSLHERTLL